MGMSMPSDPDAYSPEELAALGDRDSLAGHPPPFRNYWVIYVDIDGFSRRLADPARRIQLAYTYWDMAESLRWGSRPHRVADAALKVAGKDPAIVRQMMEEKLRLWRSRVRIFSDSIFIFLDPSGLSGRSPADVTVDGNVVPDIAFSLSRNLWHDGLAHRGALAYGKCFVDADRNVFLGEPIVSAVRWAAEQEWFGLSLTPDAATAAEREFVNAPYLVSNCSVPVGGGRHASGSRFGSIVRNVASLFPAWGCSRRVAGSKATSMISCFPPDYRRDGPEVGKDRAISGFLAAYEEAAPTKPHVIARYRATAALWLKYCQVDRGLAQYPNLQAIALGR
jgi:hypothetical protein